MSKSKSKLDKQPKRAIKSTVNVHDRTQIETVFDYSLSRPIPGGADKDGAWLRYKVDAFIFYPRQFGLDPTTYPKERFYSDVRPLIRFREPRLSYKQMLGVKGGAASPLTSLREYIEALAGGRMHHPIRQAQDEVRVFACSYITIFLKSIDRKRKRFTRLTENPEAVPPEEIADLLQRTRETVDKANDVIVEYRKIVQAAESLPAGLADELKSELRLIDEYCYYRLRDGAAYILILSERFRQEPLTAEAIALVQRIKALLTEQDAHAARAGYIVVDPSSAVSVRERFLHRRGELKRRIWAVLFLEVRTEALFAFQRQSGAMIAAGLAALWAVVAQIMVIRQAISDVANFWGISGLLFLLAAVVAYVIKDRIKELGRSYFRSGLFGRIPDQSERIWYLPAVGPRMAIGRIQESAKFEPLPSLPADIAAIRDRISVDVEMEEQTVDAVLRYTKRITLQQSIKILGRYRPRAVHDILRINIDSCLPRLGEPVRYLDIVAHDGSVHAVAFPKVYYLDLALAYSRLDGKGREYDRATSYFRLVVDKTGLTRIERLN